MPRVGRLHRRVCELGHRADRTPEEHDSHLAASGRGRDGALQEKTTIGDACERAGNGATARSLAAS